MVKFESLNELYSKKDEAPETLKFIDIVDTFFDKRVLEFNLEKLECLDIQNRLDKVLKKFRDNHQGSIPFDSNENIRTKVPSFIGKELHPLLESEGDFHVESIGWSGYPRFILTLENKKIYLSIKTTSDGTAKKTVRNIYLTKEGAKIESDGYHLALLFVYYQESIEDIPNIILDQSVIFDLFELEYKIKIEFNGLAGKMKKKYILNF